MSMSQEEIESLMNGLDIDDSDASEEVNIEETVPQGNMSEDDINDLISQTEEITSSNTSSSSEESVDDLLNSLNNTVDIDSSLEETNIDDILKELAEEDTSTENIETNKNIIEPDINNLEELIQSAPDDEVVEKKVEIQQPDVCEKVNEDLKNDVDQKISSGVFPLPAENDTKKRKRNIILKAKLKTMM